MSNLGDLEKFSRLFFHYLKKMELELTCPSCCVLLYQPTLFPCTHIVCSQCITAKNEFECDCAVCGQTFVRGDAIRCTHMEKLVTIYKRLDEAMASVTQSQGSQGMNSMEVPCHVSDQINSDGNLQGVKINASTRSITSMESPLAGRMMMLPPKGSLLPVSSNTRGKSDEELACNKFMGLSNDFVSSPPVSVVATTSIPTDGQNDDFVNFGIKHGANDAVRDSCNSHEEPSTPPKLGISKNRENTSQQRSAYGTERLHIEDREAAPYLNAQLAWLDCTNPSPGEAQSIKSNRATLSPHETDDVREAERQNSEHESDSTNKIPSTADNACSKGAVRCAFCHLFKSSEFTGPMLHYVNGKAAAPEEVDGSDVKHFHEKCFEWAPKAFFEGEIAKNVEQELARASRIKCSKCGQKGAALGCYVVNCSRSYHVPCAVELLGCRWDCNNFLLLCPSHFSCKFPSEILELKWAIKAKRSSSKIRRVTEAKCFSTAQNLPEKVTSRLEGRCEELWMTEPSVYSELVLCGSDLSTEDKALVDRFASLSGASVTGMWRKNVTHVIASTNENGACTRTQKVLMAILNGKWVLSINWIKASILARRPLFEEPFEIGLDVLGATNGPKKGRTRAMQKAPKIFFGLSFYFCNQFEPLYKAFLVEIILAAGGVVLKNIDLVMEGLKVKVFSPGHTFIVFNQIPPENCKEEDLAEVVMNRCDEAGDIQAKTGFNVIGNMCILDHIASCNSATDLLKAVVPS